MAYYYNPEPPNNRQDDTDFEPRDSPIRIYIQYDYLDVEYYAKMLELLDGLYGLLYTLYDPEVPYPLPLECRMRVEECRTGDSIELLAIEGLRYAPGGLTVLAGLGICKYVANSIHAVGHTITVLRQEWLAGSKVAAEIRLTQTRQRREEAQAVKAEIDARSAVDKALTAVEQRKQAEAKTTQMVAQARIAQARLAKMGYAISGDGQVVDMAHDEVNSFLDEELVVAITNKSTEFVSMAERAPNIRRLVVNGVAVVDKQDSE
jgi:hypothetical protein